MMDRRLLEQAGAMLDRASLRVVGAEIEPAQPREPVRRGAHRARFERDVKDRILLDIWHRAERRGAQHQHLGVRRRVAVGLDAVTCGGDDIDEHGVSSVRKPPPSSAVPAPNRIGNRDRPAG